MNQRDNVFSRILPYGIGALIGAGLALLMAPMSGEETRGRLLSKGSEIKDRAVDSVEETRSRAGRAIGELAQQTKENLNSLHSRGADVIEAKTAQVEDELKAGRRAASA